MRMLLISTWALLITVGCASTSVVVKKVTATSAPDGVRYSLPKPFLLVTPNTSGDGGFAAEVIYLADEGNTYAVQGKTKRGKYKLDVTVANSLLSKLAFVRTDAAVAAETVRASGEVVKSDLTRRQTEQDEREKMCINEVHHLLLKQAGNNREQRQ